MHSRIDGQKIITLFNLLALSDLEFPDLVSGRFEQLCNALIPDKMGCAYDYEICFIVGQVFPDLFCHLTVSLKQDFVHQGT
jgi:hypothetical protein